MNALAEIRKEFMRKKDISNSIKITQNTNYE